MRATKIRTQLTTLARDHGTRFLRHDRACAARRRKSLSEESKLLRVLRSAPPGSCRSALATIDAAIKPLFSHSTDHWRDVFSSPNIFGCCT
eukprot:9494984-Pyramimonas_sp.AAC.2